jgi:phosphatidylinositol alpha-mannosyltransferase
VAGAGLNNVLVANGGEAARIVFITRATGIPSSKVLATAALDRIFDPIGFVAMLAWGAVAFQFPPEMERLRWPAIIAALLIVVALVWLTLRTASVPPEHIPERRTVARGWRGRTRAWVGEFITNLHHLATGPRILWIVILTLLAWLGQLATFAFAAAAAHVPLSMSGNLATLLAVNIVGVIRATPGNVGVFQGAYALAAKFFGVAYNPAVAISLLIQALQILPVTLLGIALAPEFLLRKRSTPALTEPPKTA